MGPEMKNRIWETGYESLQLRAVHGIYSIFPNLIPEPSTSGVLDGQKHEGADFHGEKVSYAVDEKKLSRV